MVASGHRALCVHGHFYQPPREDPFTGAVPREFGAEPFHDFNEKIAAECYRPNAELGNFGRMSFDLGPTLASWLERHDHATYRRIVAQERAHHARHGRGNALAHVYSHAILPLASERGKRVQVAWGLADFRHRFGHEPEGMWLAETAADTDSLRVLADFGVRFTVLAPWQAAEPIDPTEPYWVHLGDGRRMAAFFYHGELSGRVSFDAGLTSNADSFGHRDLPYHLNPQKDADGESQLILVATDGELYGHHQVFRDKFLAHLLKVSAPAQGFEVTSLGRYLEAHPPRREVRLAEPTSWSCHHGVERWRGDCECTDGDGSWKWHLHHAQTRLAAELDGRYDATAEKLVRDPRLAEEEYIRVRLGVETFDSFWGRHARCPRIGPRRMSALLDAQYWRHLMFASCAWFFEDLDRIEPRNAIACALRALRKAQTVHRIDLEAPYGDDLRGARSWRTGRTGLDLLHEIAGSAGQPTSKLRAASDTPGNGLPLAGEWTAARSAAGKGDYRASPRGG